MRYQHVADLLDGVRILQVPRFTDERGYFEEVWRAEALNALGIEAQFVQDNVSCSKRGVMRGLHAQAGMGKLLTVLTGQVQLVELDIRPESSTFGQHVSIIASEQNPQVIWIPSGFANGFCVTSDTATVLYKCTAYYDASKQIRINPLDSELDIRWDATNPTLSTEDRHAPSWSTVKSEVKG